MQQTMRRDGEEIKQAGAMKLSKMSNTTKALVRIAKSFEDIMKSIISFEGVFELHHA